MSKKRGIYKIAVMTIIILSVLNVSAQVKKQFLSAKDSETSNFGWMKGFPPPADKVLHTWDGSFFQFPAIRYSVVHMREFLPTVNVSRGLTLPNVLT